MRNILLLLVCLFIFSGCDNKNDDKIKIEKAKIIFTETFKHIKNPSFDDEHTVVNGDRVKLMVIYKGTDEETHAQLIEVIVVEELEKS